MERWLNDAVWGRSDMWLDRQGTVERWLNDAVWGRSDMWLDRARHCGKMVE